MSAKPLIFNVNGFGDKASEKVKVKIAVGQKWAARKDPSKVGEITEASGTTAKDYSFIIKLFNDITQKYVMLPYSAVDASGNPSQDAKTVQGFANSWVLVETDAAAVKTEAPKVVETPKPTPVSKVEPVMSLDDETLDLTEDQEETLSLGDEEIEETATEEDLYIPEAESDEESMDLTGDDSESQAEDEPIAIDDEEEGTAIEADQTTEVEQAPKRRGPKKGSTRKRAQEEDENDGYDILKIPQFTADQMEEMSSGDAIEICQQMGNIISDLQARVNEVKAIIRPKLQAERDRLAEVEKLFEGDDMNFLN